jgi:hypothetical protein
VTGKEQLSAVYQTTGKLNPRYIRLLGSGSVGYQILRDLIVGGLITMGSQTPPTVLRPVELSQKADRAHQCFPIEPIDPL